MGDFEYVPEGVFGPGQLYPFLKMEWVEGDSPSDQFIVGVLKKGGTITPQTILPNFRFCFRLPCREPGFGPSMARASGGSQVARRPIV